MAFAALVAAVLAIIASCDNLGTINSLTGGIKYSIRVNNRMAGRAARSIGAEDTVELYITQFQYLEDNNSRSIAIISDGEWDRGRLGGKLDNAGWYSVNADLEAANHPGDIHNGPYSSLMFHIKKLRVNGIEYTFPDNATIIGTSSRYEKGWDVVAPVHPENFSGIVWSNSTISLKTILTVEPGILGTANSSGYDSQGLSTDPYKFIHVEGLIN